MPFYLVHRIVTAMVVDDVIRHLPAPNDVHNT